MKFGIDIGGTKTELCIIDEKDNIIFRERLYNKTDFEGNFNNIIELFNKSKVNNVEKIGFSLAGLIDDEKNKILRTPMKWLSNEFILMVKNHFNCNISLQNDAKCFALAESTLGAGKKYNNATYIILGTGVGGACIFNKKMTNSLYNYPIEIGDIKYKDYTYNEYLSGTAFLKNFNKKYNKNLSSPQEIMTNYRENEVNAVEYFNNYMENLKNLVETIIAVLSPEAFVFGGGLSNIKEITEQLPEYIKNKYGLICPAILLNKLGDSSGSIGACYL